MVILLACLSHRWEKSLNFQRHFFNTLCGNKAFFLSKEYISSVVSSVKGEKKAANTHPFIRHTYSFWTVTKGKFCTPMRMLAYVALRQKRLCGFCVFERT